MLTFFQKTGTYLALLLIFGVVLYALTYFVPSYQPGFLRQKPLDNSLWRLAFWTHIGLGAVALALGPFQFSTRIRNRRRQLHRSLGKVYVGSILVGSVCAFYAAGFASTGWVAATGFALLAVAWFYTTFRAYRAIRQGQTETHRRWMYRSYATTLAAVTLRIILPVELALLHLPFSTAYPIVAWLCWVPNLLVVEWWLSRQSARRPRREYA
ncbi:hypothetical protein GCM10023187_23430 [Nibrella viscosa]|uniref:DUF2306 domain-containing protein n=1 Tax=Nibrella viscosa TaxID=1084524 RepID=A0ABP8KF04_9BACT